MIESALALHTSDSLSLDLIFNLGTCDPADYRKVGEISVFYAKCNSGCATCSMSGSNCISCLPGYYLSGTSCNKYAFCHSTCFECSENLVSNKCTSCFSLSSEIVYFPMTKPTTCQILTTNVDKKWEQVITIDRNT